MTSNLLAAETSPYLQQHKDNPVHWQPWGDDAFEEARRENKPVLLSVGYAACHWCHVMAHESFEDPVTAELMNRLFVNIKLDREERPDVDALYQSALALIGTPGGWPLTMFLTPSREPFWGGTYFPPVTRYGRPGFRDVLQRVADVYREDKDGIANNTAALLESLDRMAQPRTSGSLPADPIATAAEHALHTIDFRHGGTQGAPKFPQPPLFRLLWTAHLRAAEPRSREAVVTTLNAMSLGGIYDHLGGGYARYSTDESWLVPHFEKMLYDNAQIIDLLTSVWLKTADPLMEERVHETVAWMLRDMRVGEDGAHPAAFASAVDADSNGEEGRYYVWSDGEIDQALGNDAAFFKAAYDVRPDGNWEGHSILNRLASPQPLGDDDAPRLASCRQRLLALRDRRVPPLRDDKVLAEWNGLAIAALARAATAFDEPAWLDAATAAFSFVRDLMAAPAGRLHRSWRSGTARHPAVLEDYAAMILAALALFEATGDVAALSQAEAWAEIAEGSFADAAGGYFQTADDVTDVIVRSKPFLDNALPSGNGLMAEAIARLFHLTGRDLYRRRAETTIAAFAGVDAELLPHMTGLLLAHALLENPVQAVIVGGPEADDTRALRRAALKAGAPHLVTVQIAPGTDLPPDHPAHGKTTVGGMAAAYVCRDFSCGLPFTDPDRLHAALAPM